MERKRSNQPQTEVIHSWSAPRSLSTSLMYSFVQRDDIEQDVLASMESDADKVVNDIIFGPGSKPYRFCKATLCGLCEDLGIPFQAAMLKWEAGPKPIDGIWAPWWYSGVHKSTCFEQPRKYPRPLSMSHYDLLEQSLPFYNILKRHVQRTTPSPPLPVPANEKLLAWVGDEILTRESAKLSVFDSVVQGGDSVWEGLRVYNGKVFKLEEHLDRMFDSAKALASSMCLLGFG
ncbi:hypothetical protein MLD38_036042 [Melastoma candidum]|uniref:Uncharacterized protein n=1 Tax=Melastoma candidum TaxID=119954 RepID=A0ACB9LIN8_9MYRT|nr:hypothetical protein MLD38_036042 [Melastoma candidum]